MPRPASTVPLAEASPYGRHMPQLDGIRGLAILGVVASHVFPGNTHGPISRLVRESFSFGSTGVDLFFVLSGFLITGILYDSLGDGHYFRKFYARRMLRIFPLYYGVLAAFLIVGLVHHTLWNGALGVYALYLQNTWLIPEPSSASGVILPLQHFWSLAVEEQFYLFWPLLVFVLPTRRSLLWVCSASFVLLPFLRTWLWMHGATYGAVHISTYCRADTLLAGAALALLLRSEAHDRILRVAPWMAIFVLVAAIFRPPAPVGSVIPPLWPTVEFSLRYTFLALGYVGLMAWSFKSYTAARVLSVRVLRELGKYSYGIYVLHLILAAYIEQPLKHAIAASITPNKGICVVLSGISVSLISCAAAFLSYHFYENRFLRLKRFFAYRGASRPSTAVGATGRANLRSG